MAISKTVFGKYLPGVLGYEVLRQLRRRRRCFWRIILAVWDVIQSCEIEGSSDASIHEVIPNDLSEILATADIRAIYTNGGKAFELYDKYIYPVNGIKAQKLPSTSPANAGYSLERLKEAWMEIVKTLIM